MVRKVFYVEKYWKVIVYYNVDYDFTSTIIKDFKEAGIGLKLQKEAIETVIKEEAKAVTVSNIKKHLSIVLFNRHNSYTDYLNSIVHEAEHIKQDMLMAYNIRDVGEDPAYTIGFLVSKMYRV